MGFQLFFLTRVKWHKINHAHACCIPVKRTVLFFENKELVNLSMSCRNLLSLYFTATRLKQSFVILRVRRVIRVSVLAYPYEISNKLQ